MKKVAISILFILSGLISNAQNFCGIISMNITQEGKSAPATMHICDGNLMVRYELDANGQKNSVDYLALSNGKKFMKYSIMGNEQGTELSDSDVKSTFSISKVARTGEKSEILGYTCELIKILCSDGNLTEAWITEETPVDFGSLANYLKDEASAAGISKLGIKALPLKSVTKDKNGFEIRSFSISAINNNGLDRSVYTPPVNLNSKNSIK